MPDIQSISSSLQLGEDGIWYNAGVDAPDISYPSDDYEACFAIEDSSYWFRHRNNCIASVVQSFPPQEMDTIFDIGGGNGFVSSGLAKLGFDMVVIEPGKTGALNAKKRGVKNVICATTESAGIFKQSLPAVGLFDVIEHTESDSVFLRSIRSLMKKDGLLYATVPSYSFLWSEEDLTAGHYRRYTLQTISEVLESAGFKVVFASYIFRFLPLPIFLLRTLPHKLGIKKAERNVETASRDHANKGGSVAKIMSCFLSREVKILDNKKAMRFGGSCLVVAKKQETESLTPSN